MMRQCSNGHIFDGSKNGLMCPYCGEKLKDIKNAETVGENFGVAQNSNEIDNCYKEEYNTRFADDFEAQNNFIPCVYGSPNQMNGHKYIGQMNKKFWAVVALSALICIATSIIILLILQKIL